MQPPRATSWSPTFWSIGRPINLLKAGKPQRPCWINCVHNRCVCVSSIKKYALYTQKMSTFAYPDSLRPTTILVEGTFLHHIGHELQNLMRVPGCISTIFANLRSTEAKVINPSLWGIFALAFGYLDSIKHVTPVFMHICQIFICISCNENMLWLKKRLKTTTQTMHTSRAIPTRV